MIAFTRDPAQGQRCRKCDNIGHFARCCKTKVQRKRCSMAKKGRKRISDVNQVVGDEIQNESDCVFGLKFRNLNNRVNVSEGGNEISVMVDSGSSGNVTLEQGWRTFSSCWVIHETLI